ncbi:MFS-type transporter SLC18B1 (Solute carrier family 18 member B1) [Durusdinium trenchii]|uniref:MFS-type transporter SLC18B1 (Solute carrier family 18 member B1) n=1 Tax=Durusdinium trenchii TaxID=1381693 RepID=A0ABP0KB12_9DINO
MASLWSGERGVVLVTCLGAYFLSMAMIYQMSPFFQLYAWQTCHASTSTVGLIFGAMPTACFIGNLAMGSMISRFGVEAMLNSGLLLLAISSLGFGLCDSVSGWLFWRSLQGLATAPIYTSISTRLARSFTGDGEFNKVVGLQEVFGNVGVTIGPFLGGVLYQYGGFLAPFALSACLHLLFIGITFLGTGPTSTAAEPLMEGETENAEDPNVTVFSVATVRLLLLAGISMLCLGVWGGFEPLLGDHFMEVLGPISHSLIGFLMSLSAVPSTFGAMAVPFLADRLGEQWLMTAGLLIYSVGCFLMGVHSSMPWVTQVSGLLLIGSGWGLCWTPVLPSMVETAARKLSGVPPEVARHQVSPPVSSIFNAAAALGEALGPTLGTWLLAHGFQEGTRLLSVFLFLYAISAHCSGPGRVAVRPHLSPNPQTHLHSVLRAHTM